MSKELEELLDGVPIGKTLAVGFSLFEEMLYSGNAQLINVNTPESRVYTHKILYKGRIFLTTTKDLLSKRRY